MGKYQNVLLHNYLPHSGQLVQQEQVTLGVSPAQSACKYSKDPEGSAVLLREQICEGMIPERLLMSWYGNMGETSNSEISQYKEVQYHKLYIPKWRDSKLVNAPNSVGIFPSRLLSAVFGNVGRA